MDDGVPVSGAGNNPPAPLRDEATTLLRDAATAAAESGRDDIAARLGQQGEAMGTRPLRVLVVGEFKQGKSSLVNALVGTAVCPVDDDITTAAPISLRFGTTPSAQVRFTGEDGTAQARDIDIDAIAEFATDATTAAVQRAVAVDVQLPAEMLRAGIELVDTPGIGGLGSAHGAITAAALPSADAVLLTSDASQPLTRPEIQLLEAAAQVCPTLLCAVTKIDLYPAWRKVVQLDVAALQDAGIAAQVLPVSALLSAGADANDVLAPGDSESGIEALRQLLLAEVVGSADVAAARAAAEAVAAVARQMLSTARAEHTAATDPQAGAAVATALDTAHAQAADLEVASSTWQTTLTAALDQLGADVAHQLESSMRILRREAEDALEQGDPAKIWEQYEAWLTRRTGAAVADAFVLTATRAKSAAGEVLRSFGDHEGSIVETLELAVPEVSQLATLSSQRRAVRPDTVAERGASFLRGAHSGIEVFSVLAGVVGLAVANPLVIGIGLLLGGQALRQERAARIAARREAAAEVVTRYLDDVTFAASKDLADAVRRIEHMLRHDLEARARELASSFRAAADAAQRTLAATAAQRTEKAADLSRLIERWTELAQQSEQLAHRAGALRP